MTSQYKEDKYMSHKLLLLLHLVEMGYTFKTTKFQLLNRKPF